ncbi:MULTISPECIES: endolytic transglycosylase MltG [unclassified Candidatus Frackibacter]|uniref:endolytic transglycosylase MltG n=1 Tax=unclassified Candidatus Frackibacter TaxID=2648818 RepID=UPI00088829CC|nr:MULTISPECIES: endolytic transglycosylase MltG [unclassified Candidatus Frackibacter]SDC86751.1 UPF0755 protein [Candidatus Frackibacter sp. WG11]SEN00986.1 UPF0755 protein [Candidatus Frackibacter sp. WG12]SFM08488.1 UPF0755 protein [Candidatus Frackibacter sp. WG13]
MFKFNKHNRHNLVAAIIMILFIFTLGGISYLEELTSPINSKSVSEYEVLIRPGASSSQIANLLADKGLIRHPLLFKALVRFRGAESDLKTGYYNLSTGMSIDQMIDKIVNGKVITQEFTIPEGFTVEEIAQEITKQFTFSKKEFLQTARGFKFGQAVKNEGRKYNVEGYLFPETYQVPKGTNPKGIIKVMLEEFKAELDERIISKIEDSGLTLDEVITIASLIEAEAKYDVERRLISSVIHNRLDKNMALQIDATIQYILPEHKSKILYSDLAIESPYNTYQHVGLPPGPINNPGLDSIKAALNPKETNYLYYFALDDGSHKFSKTYREHLRLQNKLKY